MFIPAFDRRISDADLLLLIPIVVKSFGSRLGQIFNLSGLLTGTAKASVFKSFS